MLKIRKNSHVSVYCLYLLISVSVYLFVYLSVNILLLYECVQTYTNIYTCVVRTYVNIQGVPERSLEI